MGKNKTQLQANNAEIEQIISEINTMPTPEDKTIKSTNTIEQVTPSQGKYLRTVTVDNSALAITFTKTITLSTNWLASGTEFKQTVNVTGILATDNPIVDLVTGVDFKNEQKAWGKVYKVVTANGSVTAYATEQLAVPLSVQVKVVR